MQDVTKRMHEISEYYRELAFQRCFINLGYTDDERVNIIYYVRKKRRYQKSIKRK